MKQFTTKARLARAAMTLLVALLCSVTGAWAQSGQIFAKFTATAGTGGAGDANKEGYDKLVDSLFTSGNQGTDWTKWGTRTMGTPPDESGSYYWVDFQANDPITIASYILTTGNDNETSGQSGRNPKSWVLKGKLNESDTWTTIATVTNDQTMQDVNFTDYSFALDVPGTYKYFRFMISATRGAAFMQLCELRFSTRVLLAAPSLSYSLTPGNGTVATLSWTRGGAAKWQLEYGTASDFTGATQVEVTGTPTKNLTGLTAETTYYARVRGIGSNNEESDWSNTVTFTPTDAYTVTESDGTSTTNYAPLNGLYKSSYVQMIYTASQLQAAGISGPCLINKLGFNSSAANIYARKPVIYICHAPDSKSSFSSNTDFVSINEFTKVYDYTEHSEWSITAGWNEFELDTPFTYDGTSNLIVAVHCSLISYYASTSFYCASTDNQVIYTYSDSADPDPATYENNWSSYGGTKNTSSNLPALRLYFDPGTGDCAYPTGLEVSNITATSADVNWVSDASTWQICLSGNEDNPTTVNTRTYALTGLTEKTSYTVKVRTVCGEDSYSSWIPKTFITPVVCPTPTELACTATTLNSATLSWTENGTATAWIVAYKKAADTDFTEVPANTNPFTLNGLTASTTYSFKVKAVNSEEEMSEWSALFDFPTACGAITTFPWTETFESYAAGNFSGLCWVNEHIEGTGTSIFKVYTSPMGGNSTHLLQLPDMAQGTLTKLVLPEMTLPANYEFSIDIYRSNNTYQSNPYELEGIRVYASTDGNIEGATELAFIPRHFEVSNNVIPAESALGWYTYELPIGMSGTCYIILRGESQYCTSTYMDNLVVKEIPSCPAPTGLSVTANSVTAHNATITWTENGEANTWIVEYATDDDFTDVLNDTVEVTPAYTFQGLDSETTYYVRVKAHCGPGDESEYSKSVHFTTAIACPAPTGLAATPGNYTASLNWNGTSDNYIVSYRTAAYADGIVEEFNNSGVPAGWTRYSGLVDDVIAGEATLTSDNNSHWTTTSIALGQYNMKLNIYGSSCKYWLVTPEFNLSQNLSFDLALTDFGNSDPIEKDTLQADDRFAVLIYADDAWHILREWNNSGSQYVYNAISATGENITLDLSAYYGKKVKIAFYGESTNPSGMADTGGDNDLHIDNVICGIPYEAGEWQTLTTEETTATLTGLTPETTYEAKVQGDCGELDGLSLETSIITFTTLAPCPVPMNVEVNEIKDNSATVTWEGYNDSYNVSYRTAAYVDGVIENFNASSIPSGWTRYSGLVDDVIAGEATLTSDNSHWTTTSIALGQYNMKLNIYGSSCKYWLVTPELNLSQNLSFDLALTKYNSNDPIATDTLQADDRFAVLIYADDAWHILREWDNSGSQYVYNVISTTGENVTLDLSAYYGKKVKIAFYGESTSSTGSNAGDNDLHIDNIICGTPYDAGDWQTVDADESSIILNGLSPNTDYEVKVQGICGDNKTDWSAMDTFTTLPLLDITLVDDETDNASTIGANPGAYANVTLSGRTLYKDGYWNTLCLPFSLDADETAASPLAGANMMTLNTSASGFDDGTLTLNFAEATSIDAGKPYIVKWGKPADLVINSADDWGTFCDALQDNNTYDHFRGKTVVLGADITVNRMAGSSGHDFMGTFDGQGHTLTVSYENTDNDIRNAPFSYVDGATIRNLVVDGSITGSKHRASGVIGETGTTTSYITNCVSSLSVSGDRYTCGFSIGGNVEIEDCVFNGKINGKSMSGGFVGYSNSNLKITNCLFDPQSGSTISGGTFYYDGGGDITPTNSYYTEALGTSQGGTDATGWSNTQLLNALGSGWQEKDGKVVPVMSTDRIVEPVFTNVIIDATMNDVETSDGKATFKGTYDKIPFTSDNRSILFLGANNTLYWPESGASIGACRAYFELNGLSAGDITAARLFFGDNEQTGIVSIENGKWIIENAGYGWYTLDGKKLDKAPVRKGLYINNGKKVVVK